MRMRTSIVTTLTAAAALSLAGAGVAAAGSSGDDLVRCSDRHSVNVANCVNAPIDVHAVQDNDTGSLLSNLDILSDD